MQFSFLVTCLLLHTAWSHVLLGRSEENGPCTGSGGAPGVCIATEKCTEDGGTFVSDKCPGTPENIKCCTKTSCGTGGKGNCRFISSCSSGNTETNKCPGPVDFKCCMPASNGGGDGGYPAPDIPTTSSGCKQVAIDGAKAISNAFPGKIKTIGCIRKCESSSSSDHCTGNANDLMLNGGGVVFDEGKPIAEWVMRHCSELKCKYVMWNKRIWEKSQDEVKEWSQWPYQKCTTIPDCQNGDRGSITANHQDHVHVSYIH